MLTDAVPFPFWLWLLAAMWSASLILWQRDVLPRDWQRGTAIVVVAYTVLLVGGAAGVTTWSVSRTMFWLAGGLSISGALVLVRATTSGAQRLGLWLTWCGIAGLLVQLGAEIVAIAALVLGGISVWRVRPIATDSDRGIPNPDAWLISALMTIVLTAWIGTARHALLVEARRPAPTQRTTALPTRETIRRWIAKPTRVDVETSWELLALAGVLASSVIFARARKHQDFRSA